MPTINHGEVAFAGVADRLMAGRSPDSLLSGGRDFDDVDFGGIAAGDLPGGDLLGDRRRIFNTGIVLRNGEKVGLTCSQRAHHGTIREVTVQGKGKEDLTALRRAAFAARTRGIE